MCNSLVDTTAVIKPTLRRSGSVMRNSDPRTVDRVEDRRERKTTKRLKEFVHVHVDVARDQSADLAVQGK